MRFLVLLVLFAAALGIEAILWRKNRLQGA